ncbi:MAG TPA: carboxypeptidase-like regulatory domain-containing protein [Bryobacteraceae bacterium]|nr:carboxypeptidase-like regulatory domain-containing protein [Bryobacteraceae bacterium]
MNCRFWLLLTMTVALGAETPHEINGRVVDAQSGSPIARARITLGFKQGDSETVPMWVLTDGSGGFQLKNVPEGFFDLVCERPGYLTSQTLEGLITPDAKSTPVTIRLVAQVAIEGTVVNEKGLAVPLAEIQLYGEDVVNGRRRTTLLPQNWANERGNFRIFGLPEGRYRIRARAIDQGSRPSSLVYAPAFYPNSPDLGGAEVLNLAPGEEKRITIRMAAPVPGREILVRVDPVNERTHVRLHAADAIGLDPDLGFEARWDAETHTFRIAGVPPGAYILDAETVTAEEWLRGRVPITVGSHDADTRIQLHAPSGVSGAVRFAGERREALPRVIVSLDSAKGESGGGLAEEGSFAIRAPEGQYRLTVSTEGPFYARSAWQGGQEVLQGEVTIAEGAESSPVQILLDGPGATVEARIALHGLAPPVISVVLLRRVGGEMRIEKRQNIEPILHSEGLIFEGVPPGEYLVCAWRTDATIPYAEPDFVERYGRQGTTLTIRGVERISVTVDRLMGTEL